MNVTALVDTGGDAVERYDYDPYGRVTIFDGSWGSRSASSYDNAILYCGYRLDPETGLYHVRNRMYHPTLGRWLQRDPLGYADGMSLYEYVASGPAGLVDPMGLQGLRELAGEYRRAKRNAERCRRTADRVDRAADDLERRAKRSKDPEKKKELQGKADRLRDNAEEIRDQAAGHEEQAKEIEEQARDIIGRQGGGGQVGGGGGGEDWDWSDWETYARTGEEGGKQPKYPTGDPGYPYGETRGLRPAWKDPERAKTGPEYRKAENYANEAEMTAARQAIAEVAENLEKSGVDPKKRMNYATPTEQERKNKHAMDVWRDCQKAAENMSTKRLTKPSDRHFYIRSGTKRDKDGAYSDRPSFVPKGTEPATSFGPFRNLAGGGDVPRTGHDARVYVDVYRGLD